MSVRTVVVGGGIVGLMSAYYLHRAGAEVVVIDRDGPDRETTSYGNAGLVVPSHFVPLAAPGVVPQAIRWMLNPRSPFYVRPRLSPDLMRWGWRFLRSGTHSHVRSSAPVLLQSSVLSRGLYDEIAAELGSGFGLEGNGLLILCVTARGLEEEAHTAEMATGLGSEAKVLDAAGVSALEPAVDLAAVGGVHYPLDAHLEPDRLMRTMQAYLENHGVEFRFQADATGFETREERISSVQVRTSTSTERVSADQFVLASGVWSDHISRQLGIRLPLQPGKGYSMTLPAPPQLLRVPAILSEARVAVTPMGTRLRVAGTMELSGFSDVANEQRAQGIIASMGRYLPAFTPSVFDDVPRWHGFRPCSPDGLPYLGRTRAWHNLVVATGHAMIGVSLAPVTGLIVSELVTGGRLPFDVRAFAPERFSS